MLTPLARRWAAHAIPHRRKVSPVTAGPTSYARRDASHSSRATNALFPSFLRSRRPPSFAPFLSDLIALPLGLASMAKVPSPVPATIEGKQIALAVWHPTTSPGLPFSSKASSESVWPWTSYTFFNFYLKCRYTRWSYPSCPR